MSDYIPTSGVRDSTAAGHLSVHLDDSRASDVPFIFEEQLKQKRMGGASVASLATHAAFFLFVLAMLEWGPTPTPVAVMANAPNKQIVWLTAPGPGGGGGGGGNRMPDPPRKAQTPGKDKIAVPVEKKVDLAKPRPIDDPKPPPIESLNIPAKIMASGELTLPGTLEGLGALSSAGSGSGGGAGTGTGTGIGPGTGSGLGPGYGGGTGGGAFRPGNGVELPRVLREVKPQYTPDAMRAKVQGVVWLECIVNPDGSVGNVEVVKSLDPTFGLDQEAIKAARQWKFVPGTRFGQPVPVIVTIELTFTLR
jgi:periplasmic protein TonB